MLRLCPPHTGPRSSGFPRLLLVSYLSPTCFPIVSGLFLFVSYLSPVPRLSCLLVSHSSLTCLGNLSTTCFPLVTHLSWNLRWPSTFLGTLSPTFGPLVVEPALPRVTHHGMNIRFKRLLLPFGICAAVGLQSWVNLVSTAVPSFSTGNLAYADEFLFPATLAHVHSGLQVFFCVFFCGKNMTLVSNYVPTTYIQSPGNPESWIYFSILLLKDPQQTSCCSRNPQLSTVFGSSQWIPPGRRQASEHQPINWASQVPHVPFFLGSCLWFFMQSLNLACLWTIHDFARIFMYLSRIYGHRQKLEQ